MPTNSPTSNSLLKYPTQSPTSTSFSGSGDGGTKIGRPNKWTPSRQRELVRLYLYSILPPKDIQKALKEDSWVPGKESTTKTVNMLLNHDPRWLRPKNREESDERILALTECRTERKIRRKESSLGNIEAFQRFDPVQPNHFSETPLEDVLALAPEEPFVPRRASQTMMHNGREDSSSGSDESRKDSSGSDRPSSSELFTPPDLDESSSSTYVSTSSLRQRLSQYSTNYVKAVARLMRVHSISDSSAATVTGLAYEVSYKTADSTTGAPTIKARSENTRPRVTRPNLANAFLTLDKVMKRQGLCLPGLKLHDAKLCWCFVVEAIDNCDRVWVSKAGLLRSLDTNYHFRDKFGNTLLHVLAARDADIEAIVNALELGIDGNAKNSAGQNFLHVFPRRYLRTLADDDWNGLMFVLQKLNRFTIRFQDRDIFGRNFFHLLTHRGKVLGRQEVHVLSFFHIALLSSRDAYGSVPTKEPDIVPNSGGIPTKIIRKPGWPVIIDRSIPAQDSRQPLVETGSPISALLKAQSDASPDEHAYINKHARLIEIARTAFNVPKVEDPEGRNGLQCLAEASLTLSIDSENVPAGSSHKRKRGRADPDSSSMRLTLRYELVQQLISVGVDLNNYDKQGNTVLIAFVTHLHDGEDDKTLVKIFQYIVKHGARIHWRNRYGETALHVAIRLGRKIATKFLLEKGANVHARTSEGKGILAVGEVHYFRARDDQPLYASIHGCMALAVQYGAKASPTLEEEWSLEKAFEEDVMAQ